MTTCIICNDSKLVEVLVMGFDTDYVECPYCKKNEIYKKKS